MELLAVLMAKVVMLGLVMTWAVLLLPLVVVAGLVRAMRSTTSRPTPSSATTCTTPA